MEFEEQFNNKYIESKYISKKYSKQTSISELKLCNLAVLEWNIIM